MGEDGGEDGREAAAAVAGAGAASADGGGVSNGKLPPLLPEGGTSPTAALALDSAATAREAFSPAASPVKENGAVALLAGKGRGGGGGGGVYEESTEEERIAVDGLASLLAAEGAEKEVDRCVPVSYLYWVGASEPA